MLASEIVDRLSDAFGKRMSDGQKRIYLEWIERAGHYAEEIIESSIQNDVTFPPLARLNNALVNKKTGIRMFSDPSVQSCYFCCDTGFVPYLFDPEDKTLGKYYTRMYACRCSQAASGIRKYFDEWNELQFEKIRKNYSDNYQYHHIVDSIKLERNNAIQKQP